MRVDLDKTQPKIACDAMCGGLARRLRMLGVDATFTAGIDDDALLRHCRAEGRVLVSSDGPLFQRRVLARGRLRGVHLPVGLRLDRQVDFVMRQLGLRVGFPRCACCNGELRRVARDAIADVVPARTLIWRRAFFRCEQCAHVFWEGSHWRRIGPMRVSYEAL